MENNVFAYVRIKDRKVRNDFFGIHIRRASNNISYTRYGTSMYFIITFKDHGEIVDIRPSNKISMSKHVTVRQQHINELALIPDEAVHRYLSTFIRK